MGAANGIQTFIVIALDAQAHPVEALRPQPPQQGRRHRIGIGFKGNFRRGRHIKAAANGVQNGGQSRRPEQGRRTAAKINGVHLMLRRQGPGFLDVGTNRPQIVVHPLLIFPSQGIKIAVAALADAVGDMNVNAYSVSFHHQA